MSLSDEYINSILSHFADKKYTEWKWNRQKFENIGQNYFGVIIPISLMGTCKDSTACSETKTEHIVLKLAPTDERYRVSGAVTAMFRKEIFVYSVLLKKYQEIQTTSSFLPTFVIPAVYFVRSEYCKEVIAMRNMCEEDGYKPYTNTAFLDLEHVVLALQSLAKLHALSFILKETDSKLYEEVTKVCVPMMESSNKRYMDIMKDRLTKAITNLKGTHHVSLLEKLKLNCGNLFGKSVELAKGTCICHGDVWKENILFKYDQNMEVLSISLPARLSNSKSIQSCF